MYYIIAYHTRITALPHGFKLGEFFTVKSKQDLPVKLSETPPHRIRDTFRNIDTTRAERSA